MMRQSGHLTYRVALATAGLLLATSGAAVAHEWDEYAWHWNPANGHYYALTIDGLVSWWDAELEAESVKFGGQPVGATLVTINDEQEQDWLSTTFPYGEPAHPWIGLYQDTEDPEFDPETSEPDGFWKWISGEGSEYQNWASGEPNEAPPPETNEDCAQMNAFASGLWQDVPGGAYFQHGIIEVSEPLAPSLDIKPGSCPNPLNRNSHGVLPVALIDTEDFDVSLVDISSVRLYRADGVGGDVAPNEGPPGPHSVVEDVATPFDGEACGCHDLSGDGIDDLVMKFRTDDVVAVLELDSLNPGDEIELVVSGSLLDGTEFTSAGDCILILPPGLPDLTVMSSAADLFVEVSPMDLNIDGGGFESFERAYDPGTTLTLTAPASVGSRPFRAWAVDGVLQTRGQTVIEVTIAEAVTARPLYGPQPPKQHGTGSHGGPTPIER